MQQKERYIVTITISHYRHITKTEICIPVVHVMKNNIVITLRLKELCYVFIAVNIGNIVQGNIVLLMVSNCVCGGVRTNILIDRTQLLVFHVKYC